MKKLALLILVILALGCGGSSFNTEAGPLVRMVNAYGGTEVFGSVGGTTILNRTGFASAGVARLFSGSQNIIFQNAATMVFIANQAITLEDGKDYTIIGAPSGVQVLQESYTPAAGNAAIRVAQAGEALAPTIDILTGPAGTNLAGANNIVRDDLASGSSIPFRDFPAGTQRWFITNQDRTVVHYEGEVTLQEGKHYTFVIGANNTVHFITVTED